MIATYLIWNLLTIVFSVEQSSPTHEWIAEHTEVLINHLCNCNFQPQDVCTKAQLHKDSTQSPKRPCYMTAEPKASSSQQQSTSSPYPLPMLHIRTPSDSQQSAYTLTVSRPSSCASYEREPSIVSSSSSSLAPSDSISMHSNALPSRSRRSRNYITPLPLSVNDLPWSDARQVCFEDWLTCLTTQKVTLMDNSHALVTCEKMSIKFRTRFRRISWEHKMKQVVRQCREQLGRDSQSVAHGSFLFSQSAWSQVRSIQVNCNNHNSVTYSLSLTMSKPSAYPLNISTRSQRWKSGVHVVHFWPAAFQFEHTGLHFPEGQSEVPPSSCLSSLVISSNVISSNSVTSIPETSNYHIISQAWDSSTESHIIVWSALHTRTRILVQMLDKVIILDSGIT